jgi:glyoxylase I family protein
MAYFSFSHIALACKDMRAIEGFYTRYFGFCRARVLPVGDEEIIFLKSGPMYLELFQAKEPAPAPPPEKDGPWYPGWRHIAFQVDDIDAKLAEMGGDARITLGPLAFDDFIPGWRTVWVADPEGNIVEITQGYVDQPNPPQP